MSSGFEWTFEQQRDGRRERRVDLFVNLCGDGYATLAGGEPTLERALPVARRVAESIQPTGS